MAVTPLFLVCLFEAPSLSEVAPTFPNCPPMANFPLLPCPSAIPAGRKRGANGGSGSSPLESRVVAVFFFQRSKGFDFAQRLSFVVTLSPTSPPASDCQRSFNISFVLLFIFPWTSCPTDRSFRFSSLSLPGASASKVLLGLISAALIRSKQPEVGFLALRKIQ